jgi:hypothetical protein
MNPLISLKWMKIFTLNFMKKKYLDWYEFHCIRIEKSLVIYSQFTCQIFVTHSQDIIIFFKSIRNQNNDMVYPLLVYPQMQIKRLPFS